MKQEMQNLVEILQMFCVIDSSNEEVFGVTHDSRNAS